MKRLITNMIIFLFCFGMGYYAAYEDANELLNQCDSSLEETIRLNIELLEKLKEF